MQEQVVTGVERVLLAALVGSLLTLSLALWQARRVALGEALLLLRLVLLVGHPAMQGPGSYSFESPSQSVPVICLNQTAGGQPGSAREAAVR